MLTKAQYDAATRRGAAKANLPSALVEATLDERAKAIRLRFRAGIELAVPIKAVTEIAKAPLV